MTQFTLYEFNRICSVPSDKIRVYTYFGEYIGTCMEIGGNKQFSERRVTEIDYDKDIDNFDGELKVVIW